MTGILHAHENRYNCYIVCWTFLDMTSKTEHKCGACGVVVNSEDELKQHNLQMHSQ